MSKPTSGDWTLQGRSIYAGNTLIGRAWWSEDLGADIHVQAHAPVDEYEAIENARLLVSAKSLRNMLQRLMDEVMMDEAIFSKIARGTLYHVNEALKKSGGEPR